MGAAAKVRAINSMKLRAQRSGIDHDVSLELSDGADGIVSAEVDGRQYEIGVRELTGGQYLLLLGSRVYNLRVEKRRDAAGATGAFEVTLGGRSYDVTVVDPKRLRSAQTTAAHDTGTARIISPMPGKVVRILVEIGARVEAGDGIVVVEAMKMQNEMKSPKAGVVISINAETGATVTAGDVLAVIE